MATEEKRRLMVEIRSDLEEHGCIITNGRPPLCSLCEKCSKVLIPAVIDEKFLAICPRCATWRLERGWQEGDTKPDA